MWRRSRYQWIIDRARSGEPVPIDIDRPDRDRIIDFLFYECDGRGLLIQDDLKYGLMWIVRSENT